MTGTPRPSVAAPIAAAEPQPEIGTIRGRPVRAAARTIGSADRLLPGAALPSSQNAATRPASGAAVSTTSARSTDRTPTGTNAGSPAISSRSIRLPTSASPSNAVRCRTSERRMPWPSRSCTTVASGAPRAPPATRAELDVDVDEPELRHRTLLRVMDHRA